MPRQIFKNKRIATAGPLPGQLTVDNLKRWTTIRKGQFTEDLDETVTHLLCTGEQFAKKVPRVREALRRGKRLNIVHYDWFEFSAVQEKSRPVKEFSMQIRAAKKRAKIREEARIERGKKDGEKFVNTNFFHLYIDRDFFPYKIDITRDNEETGQVGQRYTLCLWESDAKPHLYWFTAKFLKKKGDSQPSYHRPSSYSRKWREEMDHFMEFFRIKTGIEWEDRVIKEGTMSKEHFQYSPPRGGKPVGRRLRFSYEYCRELNARLRGLPWPPPEEVVPVEKQMGVEAPVALEDDDCSTIRICEDGEDNGHSDDGLSAKRTSMDLDGADTPREDDPQDSPEDSQPTTPSSMSQLSPSAEAAYLSPISSEDSLQESEHEGASKDPEVMAPTSDGEANPDDAPCKRLEEAENIKHG
ncbi:Fc.00g077400.m01.CDS01 [Cosmosporella sp. VM-42]